jgi:hypothetical protein
MGEMRAQLAQFLTREFEQLYQIELAQWVRGRNPGGIALRGSATPADRRDRWVDR